MRVREKAKKRLLLLFAGAGSFIVLAGSAYGVRKYFIIQHIRALKPQGLAAVQAGDELTALNMLGPYLARYSDDVEVLTAYAKVRQDLPEASNDHLGQAIGIYRRVIDLRHDDLDTQHTLLDLYARCGMATEALDLSQRLLAKDPKDVRALLARSKAMMRLRKPEEANKLAGQAAELAPTNLDALVLRSALLQATGSSPADIRAWAEALLKQNPASPSNALVVAGAERMTGDTTAAGASLKRLASIAPPDAEFTRYLVAEMDTLQLFSDATAAMESGVRALGDMKLREEFYRRLVLLAQYDRVAAELADPNSKQITSALLAYRAIALWELGRKDEVEPVLKQLDARTGHVDYASAGWASVLRQSLLNTSVGDYQITKTCTNALQHDPGNPFFEVFMGQALAHMGERQTAMQHWQAAAQVAPLWARPKVLAAGILLDAGQSQLALTLARAAQKTAGNDRLTLVTLAKAWSNTLQPEDKTGARDLLKLISDIQSRFPHEEETIPVQVRLLAQLSGRDAAIRRVREVMGTVPPPSEKVMLLLAATANDLNLGLEEECFAADERVYGLTSKVAFARAMVMNRQGKTSEGLTYLEGAKGKGTNDPVGWGTAWARYLDVMHDSRAKDAWIQLADSATTDADVQWLAISSPAAQADSAFVGRTLDRLQAINGDGSLRWRLAKATWLLQQNGNKDSIDQATLLLTQATQAAPEMLGSRLLLAQANERSGNISGAISQLKTAADQAPNVAAVSLELARLLIRQGDTTQGVQYLKRVASNPSATADELRRTAVMLAGQGEGELASSLLEKVGPDSHNEQSSLLLAELYWKQGDVKKAEALYQQMLKQPSAPVIEYAAAFFASRGQMAEADKALALLNQQKLEPGIKNLIVGMFRARSGQLAEALDALNGAVKEAPQNAAARKDLITTLLSAGRTDDAIRAANDASSVLQSDSVCRFMTQDPARTKAMMANAPSRLFLISAMMSPPEGSLFTDVVTALAPGGAESAARLRQVADQYPRYLPLQVLAVQEYMLAGHMDESVTLATRAMLTFPSATEPAYFATAALASTGRWGEALSTAMRWRERTPTNTLQPDVIIAECYLGLNRVDDARAQLQPYLAAARQDPAQYKQVILVYVQALLAAHQVAEADKTLWPLAQKDAEWRQVWIRVAADRIDDLNTAKAWMTRVTPLIEKDGAGSVVVLGQSWYRLSLRSGDESCKTTGQELMTAVANNSGTPVQTAANTALVLGSTYETSGQLAEAETWYRKAIQLDPKLSPAYNNLAMVLAKNGKGLEEAATLAQQALQVEPKVPTYYDTLAYVKVKLHKLDDAAASLKTAMDMEPANPEWRINLANVLVENGQVDRARVVFSELKSSDLEKTPLSGTLRDRYEALRSSLAPKSAS